MGERAIRLLLERLQGRTEPTHFSVEPTLKARGSTRPAPAEPTPDPIGRHLDRLEQPRLRRRRHHHGRTRMSQQLPAPTTADPGARVVSLRSQYPEGLLGVPRTGLRLTWRASAASAQLGYQVRWDGADAGDRRPGRLRPTRSASRHPVPALEAGEDAAIRRAHRHRRRLVGVERGARRRGIRRSRRARGPPDRRIGAASRARRCCCARASPFLPRPCELGSAPRSGASASCASTAGRPPTSTSPRAGRRTRSGSCSARGT